MSQGILEKMQIKPQVAVRKPVVFKLGQVKTLQILDKREEGGIEREEIIEELRKHRVVKQGEPLEKRDPKKEEKTEPKKKIRVIRKKVSQDPEDELRELKPVKVKKLKGKLVKLGSIKKDTISVLGKLKERQTQAPDLRVIAEEREKGEFKESAIDMTGLPKPVKQVNIKASEYYLNNRKKFVNFINDLYGKYDDDIVKDETKNEGAEVACAKAKDPKRVFKLLTHQNIVRDYLNMYTPYRGLLLFHGLGSGKTCSSIAIAEGMKNSKKIIVMIPASLKMNYIEELKKCGDALYKRNQYWEFIKANGDEMMLKKLHDILSLSMDTLRKKDGAWLVNVKKASNYEKLPRDDQVDLETQLDEMIGYKYQFINYNGLRADNLQSFKENGNLFDDSVVIIDEAHNFISRIVGRLKIKESLSYKLYDLLLSARNCKMVLLTGTPIINYPNEIAVIFNILCGYINVWNIPVNVKSSRQMNNEEITRILRNRLNMVDYIEYNPKTFMLKITQNPYGFMNTNNVGRYSGMKAVEKGSMEQTDYIKLLIKNYETEGIRVDESMIDMDLYGERGSISDEGYLTIIEQVLMKHKVVVDKKRVTVNKLKLLPDNFDDFKSKFIAPDNSLMNTDMLRKRILGMTSYYGDLENLMAKFDPDIDIKNIEIPMSDEQLLVYELARNSEREMDKVGKKKKGPSNVYQDSASSYRIFSRQFCNFVFPSEIQRPMPRDGKEQAMEEDTDAAITPEQLEAITDLVPMDAQLEADGPRAEPDEALKLEEKSLELLGDNYAERIEGALRQLNEGRDQYLSKEGLQRYSPKFLHLLENILDTERHQGLHLVYSNFRSVEGIEILKLIFQANGMAEFKIKKQGGSWVLDISPEDMSKPKFVLYTGKENTEVKEIARKVYNGSWDTIPQSLATQLREINQNNNMGEVIKVFMITSSGVEGISLENCRFVHITEPYWHPVRTQQAIGRARRICSHYKLPKEFQTVTVFQYIMVFSEEQKESKLSAELKRFDTSKLDKKKFITSDEALLEISNIKKELNKEVLQVVKETSIDCALHAARENKGPLTCFSFGGDITDEHSYKPDIDEDDIDRVDKLNKEVRQIKAVEMKIKGQSFAYNQETGEVYDLKSYKEVLAKRRTDPIVKGKIVVENGKRKFVKV
tara:strand:- start:12330 stop:15782 length:3453 start_codon:yes stop_codon:yes gene_type:complete